VLPSIPLEQDTNLRSDDHGVDLEDGCGAAGAAVDPAKYDPLTIGRPADRVIDL
jgi:hypothetical protein